MYVYYFNSSKVSLDYTKYYKIYIIKNILVLKRKVQNREYNALSMEKWKQFIGNLTDSNCT